MIKMKKYVALICPVPNVHGSEIHNKVTGQLNQNHTRVNNAVLIKGQLDKELHFIVLVCLSHIHVAFRHIIFHTLVTTLAK